MAVASSSTDQSAFLKRPAAVGARASVGKLAALCDRLATSLAAGIDIRRVWRSEAERARGRARRAYEGVAEAVAAGDSLDTAVRAQADYFPRLFVEMAGVGEATGSSAEIFRRLSEHYDHLVRVRRDMASRLAWPIAQLVIALLVVGVLIAVGGVLRNADGTPIDLLGFGLAGTRGVVLYANTLIGAALVAAVAWAVLLRLPTASSAAWRLIAALPVVGPCLDKIALARVAWALHLMLNVEMDVRRVASAALAVTGDPRFVRASPAAEAAVNRGQPLSEAYAATGLFPVEFLDALIVAEQTGQIVESMGRLSRDYEARAERAIEAIGRVVGFAVWFSVVALIVMLVFRLFSFYTGVLYDALDQV